VPRRRLPGSVLFALGAMPYGAFNGVVAVGLPYLLRRHGLTVDSIASIAAYVQAPAIWYVLWSPIVDMKFRRRTWILILAVSSGLCAGFALSVDASHALRTVTALLVVASVLNQPISSAIGGLVADVVPPRRWGSIGGWTQAGILGGGVLTGGVAVWMATHATAWASSITIALMIAVPALAVFGVSEPRSERPKRLDHLKLMAREVGLSLRRREVWIGFVFFLSPVGAGALMNLFSAVAVDFHASQATVIWVVAIGGAMTCAGALAGGFVLDRVDRWRAYAMAGLLSSLATGGMLLAPFTPAVYIAGAAAYALATGFAYAAFMALAFELLGTATAASGTRFTLFMAAVNVPVVYMLRLDGRAHLHFGVRGLLGMDALANAAFGLLLLMIARPVRANISSRG
jgi:MFS transporter, PAT family, beta-lactamase induction signal transducer AmpG